MSYRYCIGRHTIASHCHAQDIADHFYERMLNTDKGRMEFMASDIDREIEQILRFDDFYVDCQNSSRYGPFDLLMLFLERNNIGVSDLDRYREIRVTSFDGAGEPVFETDPSKGNEVSRTMITDLMVWQALSNLFNIGKHEHVEVDYEGERKTVECFLGWRSIDGGKYRRCLIPVERGKLENIYLAEEYIVKKE